MATFYKGFVYEAGLSAGLTIEGIPPRVETASHEAEPVDVFARRYIDEVLVCGRDRVRAEHLAILNQGVPVWNRWRRENPAVRPTLANTELADFTTTELQDCDFSYTNLCQARLPGVNLTGASFHQAILAAADFSNAHLERANFCRTDLYETNLTGAWLTGANLQGVQLAKTRLAGAHLGGCTVYGLSAWDLIDMPAEEDRLRICYTAVTERSSDSVDHRLDGKEVVKEVEVDGLDLASFMYLTLNNRNISRIIDAASRKWVLILGRFTEGKEILEAIEEALKGWKYIPIIFDFPPPERRDLIETLLLLAGLSAFVVVEMTNPRSTPLEVQAIAPNYGVPVLPILKGNATVPAMFSGLRKFQWVHAPIRYEATDDLIPKLRSWVDTRAALEAERLIQWKAAAAVAT
jgi:uncharacterized protein YjbI with pentapeptide repeats